MNQTFKIPLSRPSLVNFSEVEESLRAIWRSGRITLGEQVEKLESQFAKRCGVEHAVAVSSCTAGLMLVIRAMGLSGSAVIPSFTWASTGHALLWNGMTPVLCDIEPGAMTLDPSKVESLVEGNVSAIIAANVFGVPPALDALTQVAESKGVKLIIDSAQGFGSKYRDKAVGGFGDAEIFSLSPTKGLTAGEGGIVTTNDSELAAKLRSLRDYGKGDNGDIVDVGLSARLSEFHAAIGVQNFSQFENNLELKSKAVDSYLEKLSGLDALSFQQMPKDRTSCNTYFVMFVDESQPVTRDILHELLLTQGIETKKYFNPPLHLQTAYSFFRQQYEGRLPVTEKASREGLALPLFPQMTQEDIGTVCTAVREMV